jgi:hypothetical protein
MTTKNLSRWGAAAIISTALSSPVYAAMGNTASTYGLLPTDVGTAQALSMFNTQASALYYNPAYLTQDPRGELTVGLPRRAGTPGGESGQSQRWWRGGYS